jgi:hypothetical protein
MVQGASMFQIQNILGVTINPATEDTLMAFFANTQMPQAPTLYNVTLTLPDTEYSQTLRVILAVTRRFEFQARTAADVRFAFVTGKVAASVAPYMTLKAGRYFDSGQVYMAVGTAPTLYLASSAGATVIELMLWT